MFTGIIKALGTAARIQPQRGDLRISIRSSGLPWQDYDVGESISVNGVCLTAVELRDDGFDTDVSTETVRVTAIRHLTPGSRVNLEPAMSIGERLGGHLVSGHVDCVGTVVERSQEARSVRLRIALPAPYRRYVVSKGSICVDGVSLTVNEVAEDSFTVNIIPHTADATIAGDYKVGTDVNIEVDLIARYLEGLLRGADGNGSPNLSSEIPSNDKARHLSGDISREFFRDITTDFLRAHGYAK